MNDSQGRPREILVIRSSAATRGTDACELSARTRTGGPRKPTPSVGRRTNGRDDTTP